MKKCYLILMLIIVALNIEAHYVENMPYSITQPDGSILEVLVTGDEFHQTLRDPNGYTLLLDPETGYYVYARSTGDLVTGSEYIAGKHDPSTLGISPYLYKEDPGAENLRREQQAFIENISRNVPIGAITNIVGLVRFNDQTEFPVSPAFSHYDNMHNSLSQQSLKDYYLEVSANQLTIDSYTYPPPNASGHIVSLQADHDRNYYRPYSVANPDGWTTDQMWRIRFRDLCAELVEKIEPFVPAGLDLDLNDDGINDALSFIFRGDAEPGNPILWPSSWGWAEPIGTINNYPITHLLCQFETSINISILCHEMAHKIGIPDFYHGVNNGISPLGQWCIMDGSSNALHLPTYTKWKYGGWFNNIPVITPTSTPTTYTLTAINQAPYSSYKILSSNPNQFYVLEYRKQAGRYEIGVPGTGLIVYRIITSHNGEPVIGGNIAGPPDELYVYRPNGTVVMNGDLHLAHFGPGERTAIHNYTNPKPWLYVDDFTTPDGSLAITDIGPSGGETISFVLRDTPPHIWTGNYSSYWHVPSNWAQGSIPTEADDVVIPGNVTRYPIISSYNASCRNLLLKPNATLTINSNNLYVSQDMTAFGTVIMNGATAALYVYGNLNWDTDSSMEVNDPGAAVYCYRDCLVKYTSFFRMTIGTFEFRGPNSSTFINKAPGMRFRNLHSNKTAPGTLTISSETDREFSLTGNFINMSNSATINNYPGDINVMGIIADYNPDAGIQWDMGTLYLYGESQSIYLLSPNSYFHNLFIGNQYISTDPNLLLNSNLTLKGNLTIVDGVLDPSIYTIKLAGNWSNTAGQAAFIEGSSKVIFTGTGESICNGDTFNELELGKAGYGQLTIPYGNSVTSNSYKWSGGVLTVNGGTFTALDMADPWIRGIINLNSGYIHLHQDSSQYLDLQATMNITGGELHLYGGNGDTWWPYDGYAALNMQDGLIDVHDNGIYIGLANTFNTNITGGIIRTSRNFTCHRNDFNPAGGILELYSAIDAQITMTAGTLHNLKINKLDRSTDNEPFTRMESIRQDREGNIIRETRANTVRLMSNLSGTNSLTIENGTLWLWGHEANFASNIFVYDKLRLWDPLDKIISGADFFWYNGSEAQITAGTIECNSYWNVNNGANVILPATVTTHLKSPWSRSILLGDTSTQFGNLIIGDGTPGGIYTIHNSSAADLWVTGNLTISTQNELDLGIKNLYVLGNLDLDGKLDIHSTTAMIQGKPDFATTSILSINSGNFYCFDSTLPRTNYLRGTLNINSGNFETWYNSLEVEAGSINTMNSGTLKCNGINAVYPNTFQPIGGTVIFNNNLSGGNYTLNVSNGNWLPNLVIDSAPTGFILANDLIVKGSLSITSGNIDVSPSNYSISVGGDWNNYIGTAAFNERNGLVVFNGTSLQFFNTNEEFYNLTIDKTSYPYLPLADEVVISISNNLNIENGTLILATDNHLITNNLTISSMAGLNTFYSNESYIVVNGNWIDNNYTSSNETGFFYDQSTVIFNGTGNQSIIRNTAPLEFNNLIIEKPPSSYCFFNNPVEIHGFFELNGGIWQDTGNFFNHHFYKNFTVNNNGSFSSNTQNSVHFKGTLDQALTYNGTSGYFYNVIVDKSANRSEIADIPEEIINLNDEEILRYQRLTLGSLLPIMNEGNLTIESAFLDSNGHSIICTGNLNINDGAILQLDAGSTLYMGTQKSLNVNGGGRLEVFGSAGMPATVTSFFGYYDLNVELNGTIAATHGLFEYMTHNGLHIKSGATIDPVYSLGSCTFSNGSIDGTLLTINNNDVITIPLAHFPVNTWGGSSNVSKTFNQGSVSLIQSYGDFSGEVNDNDPYNRINWSETGFIDIQVVSAVWSDPAPYCGDTPTLTVTILNSGTSNISAIIYLNLYYNLNNPPAPYSVGSDTRMIRTMPPGELLEYSFVIENIVPEDWNTWLLLDPYQLIDDADPSNNIFGPVPISWANLPEITDLQIEYLPATNSIRLFWTYPTWVDNFNIFRGTEPYFEADYYHWIARPPDTATEYIEPVEGMKYFYRVNAERYPID